MFFLTYCKSVTLFCLQDRTESTPLQDASANNQREIQALLAENGGLLGNVDAAYLLNNAAKNNDVQGLRSYLENKVSLMVRDQQGRTPLHIAAAEGNIEALAFLLNEAKVNVNPIDS